MPKRLTLRNGEWFDIKESFKMRDKKDLSTYAADGVSAGGADGTVYRLNPVKYRMGQVATRTVNWGITEERLVRNAEQKLEAKREVIPWPVGGTFKAKIEAVESLDEDVFEEMFQLLNAHIDRMDAEAAAEKNDQGGENESSSSSPSAT